MVSLSTAPNCGHIVCLFSFKFLNLALNLLRLEFIVVDYYIRGSYREIDIPMRQTIEMMCMLYFGKSLVRPDALCFQIFLMMYYQHFGMFMDGCTSSRGVPTSSTTISEETSSKVDTSRLQNMFVDQAEDFI